jgi:hypothetical protein
MVNAESGAADSKRGTALHYSHCGGQHTFRRIRLHSADPMYNQTGQLHMDSIGDRGIANGGGFPIYVVTRSIIFLFITYPSS